VNSILAKHKRARLYDKYVPLKALSGQVAHLRPAISPKIQELELQQQFVRMQWEFELGL
jgi:hypothetical protein